MAAPSSARRTIPAAKMRWTKDRQSWQMTRTARPVLNAAEMKGRTLRKVMTEKVLSVELKGTRLKAKG